MLNGILSIISEYGIERTYPIFVLIILRPFGLLFGFLAFTWTMQGAQAIKISIAIALALPTLVSGAAEIEELIVSATVVQLAPISLKEFAVGYAIGLLASLPFFALQYAGAITDSFRGENDTGLTDPTGGTLHTFSLLYLVVGFFAFFSFGGLSGLVHNLYLSYDIWPIGYIFPTLSASAGLQAVDILTRTLVAAIQIALPLLAMLVVIEFSVSIAARLGRRFNFYDLAFPLKNLAAVLSLPLIIGLIWSISEGNVALSGDALRILERAFE